MNNPELPSLRLLIKLGSIVVHADELTSPGGHEVDHMAIRVAMEDPEVQEWIKQMGVFLPLKRS